MASAARVRNGRIDCSSTLSRPAISAGMRRCRADTLSYHVLREREKPIAVARERLRPPASLHRRALRGCASRPPSPARGTACRPNRPGSDRSRGSARSRAAHSGTSASRRHRRQRHARLYPSLELQQLDLKIDCCGKVRVIFTQPAKLCDISRIGAYWRTLIGGRHRRILAPELGRYGRGGADRTNARVGIEAMRVTNRGTNATCNAFRVSRLLPVDSADYILPREADVVTLRLHHDGPPRTRRNLGNPRQPAVQHATDARARRCGRRADSVFSRSLQTLERLPKNRCEPPSPRFARQMS